MTRALASSVVPRPTWPRWYTLGFVSFIGLTACGGPASPPGTPVINLEHEAVHRANNIGVALLEQFDYEGAAAAFQDAVALDESYGPARVNHALALLLTQDLELAEEEARRAADLMPEALEPQYLLGLIARAENRPEDAREAFSIVHEADPEDVGTNINLGQISLEARDYGSAVEQLQLAYEREPYNVTAAYNLGLAMVRSGDTAGGRRRLEEAQALRSSGYAVTYGNGYLAAGRYAEALASTGAEASLVDRTTPGASFAATIIAAREPDASGSSPFGRRFEPDEVLGDGEESLAASLGGAVTAIDIEGDGDLDLFVGSADGERLLRNDGADGMAEWSDVTEIGGLAGGAPDLGVPVGAISGDYNNDLAPDLFVLRHGQSSLYQNDGEGQFTDVTADAGIPPFPYLPGAAAFADIDHDGDVDLAIAGLVDLSHDDRVADGESLLFPNDFAPAPFLLLQNNQDGTFLDVTESSGLTFEGHTVALIPTDFDNRRDLDLLVVDYGRPPQLFMNLRDATFRNVAADVGLADVGSATTSVAVADINKDDFPDVVFGQAEGLIFALSDGRGAFTLAPGPAGGAASGALSTTQFLDYDNDGLLDLLTGTNSGMRLHRNLGLNGSQNNAWDEVTETVFGELDGFTPRTGRGLAVADFDLDGDSDLVGVGAAAVMLATNSGVPGNDSLRVTLSGLVSNRTGIGAKIQLRAGSLTSRLETSAATPAVAPSDVLFGLGRRAGADVARVLWPSGILQAEIPAAPSPGANDSQASDFLSSPITVSELDREPSSCPLLFTWNGTEFEFVTDFLGGGEMGYWHAPGHYSNPDPVEYVRIRGDQLHARDGVLELRITNELEEAVFFDRAELIVVSHPRTIEVHPNEGMTNPPKPHRLHMVGELRVPRKAVDDDGVDVRAQIATLDRRYPSSFELTPFRGYAKPHALTLDLGLGTVDADASPVLLLTGWTAYSFSSDNVAALQAGLTPMPPVLEIKALDGQWRRSSQPIGIPVGRPQTIALDLAGQLQPGEHEVRIVTSMRIYWDQILVGRGMPSVSVQETRLDPVGATLSARGFSAELHPGGTQPTVYDYTRVSATSPWKTMAGDYTREGDVLPLMNNSDDMFVIARDGDEIALRFDASQLPALEADWTRTFLLKADGFSKEMDINSASPDRVEPLPFHAMSGYPYAPSEQYPTSERHRLYRDTYNTRSVITSVPRIDVSLTGESR